MSWRPFRPRFRKGLAGECGRSTSDYVGRMLWNLWKVSFEMSEFPVSTFFSGFGCAEVAMRMIASAVKEKTGNVPFRPSFQVEVKACWRPSCL